MNILSGQQLVNSIRKDADKIKKRLWIAVPYIGSLSNVRMILGKTWLDKNSIEVKLITDINELTKFNSEALKAFLERGKIRDIRGLHSKVYLLDDIGYLTSANLTKTAFSKRVEVGMKLDKIHTQKVKDIYSEWWDEAKIISKLKVMKKIKSKPKESSEDLAGAKLIQRCKMPEDPGGELISIQNKYLNYENLVEMYKEFASYYSKMNRVWKNAPLFCEVDAFLNYLYHDHKKKPISKYKKNKVHRISKVEMKKLLKKYIGEFRRDAVDKMIKGRMDNILIAKKFLSKRRINSLNKSDIKNVFDRVNSLSSYGFHKKNALEKNSLNSLRNNLKILIHGKDTLPERFTKCSSLKNVKQSTMFEIIGLYYSDDYPLINNNSLSGLRFFGYDASLK